MLHAGLGGGLGAWRVQQVQVCLEKPETRQPIPNLTLNPYTKTLAVEWNRQEHGNMSTAHLRRHGTPVHAAAAVWSFVTKDLLRTEDAAQ